MAWLTGYDYRKQIPITGATGAGTSYQVLLKVYSGLGTDEPSSVFLEGHAENFPNDVRFTDDDGITELDHWLEHTGDIFFDVDTAIDASWVTSDTIWVGTGGKIYKRPLTGGSWTEKFAFPGTPGGIHTVYVDSNGYIYVSADNTSGNTGLWRSIDNGDNWTKVLILTDNGSIWRIAERTSTGTLIAAEYSNESPPGTGHSRLWRSTDNGANWSECYEQENNRHMHGVWYDPNQDAFYAAQGESSSKILKSTNDGVDWSTIYSGGTACMTSFACDADYRYWGSDGTNEIRRTSDDSTFSVVYTLPAGYAGWFFTARRHGNNIYFGTYISAGGSPNKSVIVKSTDQGDNWTIIRFLTAGTGKGLGNVSNDGTAEEKEMWWAQAGETYGVRHQPNGSIFWVEIADDLGSNQNFYIYYGKSGEASGSNGGNTFPEFFDDFLGDALDTDVWEDWLGGQGVVANSILTVTPSVWRAIATINNVGDISNRKIEAKAKYNGGSTIYDRIALRIEEGNNTDYVFIRANGNRSIMKSRINGSWQADKLLASGLKNNKFYILALHNLSNVLYASLWDLFYNQRGSIQNYGHTAYQADAIVDFRTSAGVYSIDWIRIRKYVDPEPVVGTAENEETGFITISDVGNIASEEAFGTIFLNLQQTLLPSGIASSEAFGTLRVRPIFHLDALVGLFGGEKMKRFPGILIFKANLEKKITATAKLEKSLTMKGKLEE